MSPVTAQQRAQTVFATSADSQATSRPLAPTTKWKFPLHQILRLRERDSSNHYIGHDLEMIFSLS